MGVMERPRYAGTQSADAAIIRRPVGGRQCRFTGRDGKNETLRLLAGSRGMEPRGIAHRYRPNSITVYCQRLTEMTREAALCRKGGLSEPATSGIGRQDSILSRQPDRGLDLVPPRRPAWPEAAGEKLLVRGRALRLHICRHGYQVGPGLGPQPFRRNMVTGGLAGLSAEHARLGRHNAPWVESLSDYRSWVRQSNHSR